MRLPKQTRTALHKASKPIWIEWPKPGPFLVGGKSYRVSTGAKPFYILVTEIKPHEALAQIYHDPAATLWGLKGTRNSEGKYESEPEPVKGEWLERQCRLASQASLIPTTELRHKEKKKTLEQELQIAKANNRAGRTRKLEAQLSQEARRAA